MSISHPSLHLGFFLYEVKFKLEIPMDIRISEQKPVKYRLVKKASTIKTFVIKKYDYVPFHYIRI